MKLLFDIPTIEPKKEELLFPDKKCRDCVNMVRPNPYSSKYTYCKITPCRRTPYGMRRVYPMSQACNDFELKNTKL